MFSDNSKVHFYVFGSGGEWFNYLFEEAKQDERIIVSKDKFSPFCETNIFIKLLFSGKCKVLGFLRPLFWNVIVKRRRVDSNACFVFTDMNVFTHDGFFLKHLKKRYPGAVCVRWFLDLVELSEIYHKDELAMCKSIYDVVITYDRKEAERYGFKYVETPYPTHTEVISKEVLYDVAFIGTGKIRRDGGVRYNKLIELYDYLVSIGLKPLFYIANVPDELQKKRSGIVYNKFVSYKDILEIDSKSKAILEVTQKGETGTTLRLFESILLKKKLLFDNMFILSHELYDRHNMLFFNSTADISTDFINSEFVPNNGICEKMSYLRFLADIEKIITISDK